MRIYLITLFVLVASAASAQELSGNHSACARDVSRYCRSKMNDGDMVILSCLKENRAKLSKACTKVLTDNGQ